MGYNRGILRCPAAHAKLLTVVLKSAVTVATLVTAVISVLSALFWTNLVQRTRNLNLEVMIFVPNVLTVLMERMNAKLSAKLENLNLHVNIALIIVILIMKL